MEKDLSQLVKAALEIDYKSFAKLVEKASQVICSENAKPNYEVIGRLAKLKPYGEALIIGDLHGDLESLVQILEESDFLEEMRRNDKTTLIFLGDYGDRGEFSKEVYHVVLKLKLLFPHQVILMRGNHEGPEDLLASPHDLPVEFQMKFSEDWEKAYSKIRSLFPCLFNAVLVEDRYLIIHGGLPSHAKTIEDLAYAHKTHSKQSFLEEMLWSDPDETAKELQASPRGAGKLFGKNVTAKLLANFGVNILIRGHEACDKGFKINHDGKVLTLFSRKGPPYFNSKGAYLRLELSVKFENAWQLIPYIHDF